MMSSRLFALVSLVCISLFIVGCSETKSASTPVILGSPPQTAYIDVMYEYEFGADGGDNILSYHLVKAPSWMNIETINGAKPLFRIYGVPYADFDEFIDETFQIEILVTDGSLSSTKVYTILLTKNKATVFDAPIDFFEDEQNEIPFADGFDSNCVLPSMEPKQVGDKTVYPVPVVVRLEQPPVTRTVIEFTLKTSYRTDLDERADRNITHARADHDYVDVGGQVVFEPGVFACVFAFDVFGDSIIEGVERMSILFPELLEGFTVLPSSTVVNIQDSEPSVLIESEPVLLSEGQEIEYTATLGWPAQGPVSFEVFRDATRSTATADDFELVPATVEFALGEFSKTFKVKILDDGDNDAGAGPGLDDVLELKTDVHAIFDLSPMIITINELVTQTNLVDPVNGERVSNMVVDEQGLNVVAIENIGANKDVEFRIFDRVGVAQAFSTTPADAVIASTDLEEELMGGSAYTLRSDNKTHEMVVVVNTKGDVEEPNAGVDTNDIVVRSYRRDKESSTYVKAWTLQYGGAGNDVSQGVEIDVQGNVYVYGYTDGSIADGVVNKGGNDAFVSKFSSSGVLVWTRQFGSSADDRLIGGVLLTLGDFFAGTTTGQLGVNHYGDMDSFFIKLNDAGEIVNTQQFGTLYKDELTDIDADEKRLWLTGHSIGEMEKPLGEFDPSIPRNSIDVFFQSYSVSTNLLLSTLQFGDDGASDTSGPIINGANNRLYIGSTTPGEYESGAKSGASLLQDDAVLSAITSETTSSTTILPSLVDWHRQFGSVNQDKMIDLNLFSDHKLLTLSSELDGGNMRYLLDPFNLSGESLLVP